MRRPLAAASLVIVLLLVAPALAAAPDCTALECVFIPIALDPPSTLPRGHGMRRSLSSGTGSVW